MLEARGDSERLQALLRAPELPANWKERAERA
jgi:hypothetical protein